MSTPAVPRQKLVTIARLFAIVAAFAVPAPAHAQTATGAVLRVDREFDPAAFARFFQARYHIVLRHVVAADIDRDGDVDVLATTDRGLLVWVNDGTGRLTSQAPKHQLPAAGSTSEGTLRTDRTARYDTILNDAPALRLTVWGVLAPLIDAGGSRLEPSPWISAPGRASSASRAPPA